MRYPERKEYPRSSMQEHLRSHTHTHTHTHTNTHTHTHGHKYFLNKTVMT